MPAALTPDVFARLLQPGQRVYWPGCAGASALFDAWFVARPQSAAGLNFCGVWIPGINTLDPGAWHPQARAETFFMTPELHGSWQRGAVDHRPWHYSAIARWMAEPGHFDVLLLQVAPPDAQGRCSLSIAADFAPIVLQALQAGAVVLAHVNPRLPSTAGPTVAVADITAWVEADMPLLTVAEGAPSAATQALAAQVADQVRNGDTLQFGLGRLQSAVQAALRSHRGLRLHSGMVSDGLLGLQQAGALAAVDGRGPPVTTGVALGSTALYAAMADAALVRFAPVSHTHDAGVLAAVPRLVSINAAFEVDLLGQVNAETLAGRQRSGSGGLVDFARGARASAHGRSLIAINATAGRGPGAQVSRIVPLLRAGPVSMARADVDTVVTEHGAAPLRHLGVDARAQALIGIAAPEHRDDLSRAWHTLRRTF